MIVDATGAIMAEAGNAKEELLVAELDLDKVRGDRKKVPWWRDRRIDLYTPLVE
jgi:predicted amidohydrolase